MSEVVGREVCHCADAQERVARILISAPVEWLSSPDGDISDGWAGLEEVIKELHRIVMACYLAEGVKVEFIEWEQNG